MMKRILFGLLVSAFCQVAVAEGGAHGMGGDGKQDAERFEKHKKMMLEEIDARIASVQALKSCISSAKAREDVEKCRHEEQDKMKKHHEEMEGKMKEHKKEAIDDRIKKLQEEKSKLDEKK